MNPRTKLGKYLVRNVGGRLESEIINREDFQSKYTLINVPSTTQQIIKEKVKAFYDGRVDIVGDHDWGFNFMHPGGGIWSCEVAYVYSSEKCVVAINSL